MTKVLQFALKQLQIVLASRHSISFFNVSNRGTCHVSQLLHFQMLMQNLKYLCTFDNHKTNNPRHIQLCPKRALSTFSFTYAYMATPNIFKQLINHFIEGNFHPSIFRKSLKSHDSNERLSLGYSSLWLSWYLQKKVLSKNILFM